MKKLIRYFSFIAIASLVSCNADNIVVVNEGSQNVDCGSFDLFRPQETVGNYYYINGVRLSPLDTKTENGITNTFYCKTLTNQMAFCINTEYKRLQYDELKNIPNIKTDSLVGDTLPGAIVNPIQYEHASMRFNKDIYYKGVLVPAHTNLIGRIPISVPTFYFPLTISPWVLEDIHMSRSDFFLPNGKYSLLVSWETYDGKAIIDTVDVTIFFK